MKKLVCDLCGKELDERDCYDEDGYSKYVNVEIRNSRQHQAEYDICNDCYEDILKYAKEKGDLISREALKEKDGAKE